jgi:flavin reductase (DIM6/NTAB) family NADH-FMN oxidoreductase RutF
VSGPQPPSGATLEKVFRSFPYALFVVAAGKEGGQAMAMIATWATQVSFHPPMLVIAIERESRIRDGMEASKSFSINFLAAEARAAAARFLKTPVSDDATLGGEPLTYSPHGIPLLASSKASLGCRIVGMHEVGDHVLYVGEVVDALFNAEGDVLTLKETGWRYFR